MGTKEKRLEKGLENGMVNSVRNLMDTMKLTAEQAMDALKVLPDVCDKYLSRL